MQRNLLILCLCIAIASSVQGATLSREKREFRENDDDGVTVEVIKDDKTDKAITEDNDSEKESTEDESSTSDDESSTNDGETTSHENESNSSKDEMDSHKDKSDSNEEFDDHESKSDDHEDKLEPKEDEPATPEKEGSEIPEKRTTKNKETKKRWYGWGHGFGDPGYGHGFPFGFSPWYPYPVFGPAWAHGPFFKSMVPKGKGSGKASAKHGILYGGLGYPGYGWGYLGGGFPYGYIPWNSGWGLHVPGWFYRNNVPKNDKSKKHDSADKRSVWGMPLADAPGVYPGWLPSNLAAGTSAGWPGWGGFWTRNQIPGSRKWYIPVGVGYGHGFGLVFPGYPFSSPLKGWDLGIPRQFTPNDHISHSPLKRNDVNKRFIGLAGLGLGPGLGYGYPGLLGVGLGYGMGSCWHGHCAGPYAPLSLGNWAGGLGCGGCGWAYKSTVDKNGKTKRDLVYACDKDNDGKKAKRCFGSWPGYGGWGGFGGFGGIGLHGGFGGLHGYGGWGFNNLHDGFGGFTHGGYPDFASFGGYHFGGLGCGGCGWAYKSKVNKDGKTKRELVYACDKDKKNAKRCFGGLAGFGLGYPSWGLGWGGLGGFGGWGHGLYGDGFLGLGGLGLGCGGCGWAYKSKIGKDGKSKRELVYACDKNRKNAKRCFGGFGWGLPWGFGGWGGLGGWGHGLGGWSNGLYHDAIFAHGAHAGLGLGCGGCGWAYKSKVSKDGKSKRQLVFACDKNKKNAKRCFGLWGAYGLPIGLGGFGGYGLGGFGHGPLGLGYGLFGDSFGYGLGCGGCGWAYKSKIGKDGKAKQQLVYACDKNKKNAKRCFGLSGGYGGPLNWGGAVYGIGGWGHGLGGWGHGLGHYGLGGWGNSLGHNLGLGLYGDGFHGGLGCGGCGWAYKSKVGKDGKTKRDLVYACDKDKKNAKRCFGGFGLWGGLGHGFGGFGFGHGHGWGIASPGYDVGYPYFGYGCLGCGFGHGHGLGWGGCGAFYRSKVDKNGKTKRELIYDCPKQESSNKRFVSPFAVPGYGMWPYGGMSHHGYYDYGSAPLARTAMAFGPGRGIGVDCNSCGWAEKSTITKDGKTKRNLVYKCDKASKKHGCFADLHAFWDGLHRWGWGGLGYGGFGCGLGGCGLGGGCFGGGCGLVGFGHGLNLGHGCGWYYRNKIAKEGGKTKRELVYACPKLKDDKASKKHFGFGALGYGLPLGLGFGWGLGYPYGGFGIGLPIGLGYGGLGCHYRSEVAKGKKTAKRHMVCDSSIAHAPFAGMRNRFNAGFGPYARGPWWGGYAVGLYPGLGPYSFGIVSKSKVEKEKASKKCGIGGCPGGLGLGWGGYQGPSGTEWGYPGSGFGTYPPRFPWMKAFPWARSTIYKDVEGEKRGDIPKSTKKQTIHLGYGYASGDNYRLGFGFGGMGGLDPFQTLGSHVGMSPGGPDAQHVFGRSNVPRQVIGFPGHAHGHFGLGPAYPAPRGHPVTHPGFSTMGYPGHAVATVDVKKAKVQANSASKRQLHNHGAFGPLVGRVGLAHGPGGLLPGHAPGLLGAGLLGHGPGILGHGPGVLGHGPGVLGHGHFAGHPITHPGFSTLGFPGHAMATLDIKNKIPKKNNRPKRQAIMAAPVPHFFAGLSGPATHPPILAGFAPAVAPVSAPMAVTSPALPLLHQPVALSAPAIPQIVPISSAGQPLTAQALTIPIQHGPVGAPVFPMGK